MNFARSLRLQEFGARIWKTGLAVLLALLTFHVVAREYASTAGIAAFLAVQPSVARSRQTIQQQLLGNLLGAATALILIYLLGDGAPVTALGVILILVLLRRFVLPDAVSLAVITMILVLESGAQGAWQVIAMRVAAVLLGTVIGYLVNRFVAPPDYGKLMDQHLAAAGQKVDTLLTRLAEVLTDPEAYTKPAIKGDLQALQAGLAGLRQYIVLQEEGGHTLPTYAKAVNSCFVFGEAAADIHKAVLQGHGLDQQAAGAVADVIHRIIAARRATFAQVGRRGKPPVPEVAEAAAGLEQVARMAHERIADPDRRHSGLMLYSVHANLEHMVWRLQSLERLLGE